MKFSTVKIHGVKQLIFTKKGNIRQVINLPYDTESTAVFTANLPQGDLSSANAIAIEYYEDDILCLQMLRIYDVTGVGYDIIQDRVFSSCKQGPHDEKITSKNHDTHKRTLTIALSTRL